MSTFNAPDEAGAAPASWTAMPSPSASGTTNASVEDFIIHFPPWVSAALGMKLPRQRRLRKSLGLDRTASSELRLPSRPPLRTGVVRPVPLPSIHLGGGPTPQVHSNVIGC